MNRIFSFMKERVLEIILIILVIFLFICLFFLFNVPIVDKIKENKIEEEKNILEEKRTSLLNNLLENIEAKSFYVLDINKNEVMFSKESQKKLPLASLTKVMSSLVISEKLPSFTLIPITEESIKNVGDNGLLVNEKWQLKNLLDFSLITSSNDGFSALATTLDAYEVLEENNTVSLMNKKAKELGLNNSEFFNETGLDFDKERNGGYSSSEDFAKLIVYILKERPELLSATSFSELNFISENDIKHRAINTNSLSQEIPSIVASKTGFTNLSGGNLMVVFEIGPQKPLVAVVLGSSYDGRFSDMKKIIETTFQFYSNLN